MPEATVSSSTAETPKVAVQSPPPAAQPAHAAPDPRAALHELAQQLRHTHSRRLLVQYLQMRRALRA